MRFLRPLHNNHLHRDNPLIYLEVLHHLHPENPWMPPEPCLRLRLASLWMLLEACPLHRPGSPWMLPGVLPRRSLRTHPCPPQTMTRNMIRTDTAARPLVLHLRLLLPHRQLRKNQQCQKRTMMKRSIRALHHAG